MSTLDPQRVIIIVLSIAFFLGGCGDEEVTIEKICEKWGRCTTVFTPEFMECPYKSYDVFSQECLEGLNRIVCNYDVDMGEVYEVEMTCWPECSPETVYCRGDHRVVCDGREHVVDCVIFCDERDSSGTCGETVDGTSDCICE